MIDKLFALLTVFLFQRASPEVLTIDGGMRHFKCDFELAEATRCIDSEVARTPCRLAIERLCMKAFPPQSTIIFDYLGDQTISYDGGKTSMLYDGIQPHFYPSLYHVGWFFYLAEDLITP